jgi:hypothetical protein
METRRSLIAPCGLDCATCDIRRAGQDPALAKRLAEQFRARGHANAVPEWFHCDTCRGDMGRCWSDDCWIQRCCVVERRLEHCGQCGQFPCTRLAERAARNERYAAALQRLREMGK